jgi:hypothetical protein
MADDHQNNDDFEFDDEQEAHVEEIRNIVLDYVEDNDVPEATAIVALIELAVSMNMGAYVASVEKPSVAGLKMEIERFGKEIDAILRDAKKNAEGFIEDYRAATEEEGNDD